MGYNIHITLSDDWVDSEKNPISKERLKGISSFSDKNVKGVNPNTGEVIEQSLDGHIYWPLDESKERYMFHLIDGRLEFQYANDTQIEIAKDLASRLGANIQGDEGEIIFKPKKAKSSDELEKRMNEFVNKIPYVLIPLALIAGLLKGFLFD